METLRAFNQINVAWKLEGKLDSKLINNNFSLIKASMQLPNNKGVKPIKAVTLELPHTEDLHTRRTENVEGDFYVDNSCIDCDACCWIAPDNFARVGEMSAVSKQPEVEEERTAMLQALLSCPTKSIQTRKPTSLENVGSLFPLAIHGLPGVYHCGYHSSKSDGATPFLITSPTGNILVDSPRYTTNLAHHIAKLGGVRYMFLTHLHDVGDHAMWQRRFTCDRIMHMGDIKIDTFHVEMKLEGSGPWSLGSHIDLIYTPGHTTGSICLLYKPLKALFSGDHIGLASDGKLTIWPQYCQHSVKRQIESLHTLLNLDFEWILPGHARRIKFDNLDEKNADVLKLIEEQARFS